MNIPVFDFHCDTAFALMGENLNSAGELAKNTGHIDLDRASRLSGYAQCFACFTTSIPELMKRSTKTVTGSPLPIPPKKLRKTGKTEKCPPF